ncbi:DUF4035 domain-containing protein [Frankia sp. AgPm24]|uniref:phage tail assembly protein T n=1 Tax=Frankia sp. AgPm24 TaxID=631128 RepID=UPI0020109BD8|nr:DUF4035 domain-containing protein [Frankia sp. AgPm24]MCK9922457.1 DUF4035 domain-containing protein [Frankia sp. AgPm24]
MTVAEMLARIDSREITAWAAYEQVHGPLGPVRGDYHAALIAATITNMMAGKKSGRRKLSDFLLEWDRRPQTWEDQLSQVRTINRAMGGTDNTRAGGGDRGEQQPAGDAARPDRRRRRRPRA